MYFWETETQRASKGGAEREGDTESELSAQSLKRGSNPQSTGSWLPKSDRLTDWATQGPQFFFFFLREK